MATLYQYLPVMPTPGATTVHPFFQKKATSETDNASQQQSGPSPAASPPKKAKRGRPPKKVSNIVPTYVQDDHTPAAVLPAATAEKGEDASRELITRRDNQRVEITGEAGQKRRRLTPPVQDGNWLKQLQNAAKGNLGVSQSASGEAEAGGLNQGAEHSQDAFPASHEAVVSSRTRPTRDASRARARSPPEEPSTKITPSPKKTRKTLKLNGAGGFGTPSSRIPPIQHGLDCEQDAPSPKRGRRKKRREPIMVVMHYGQDSDSDRLRVGHEIDSIMAAPRRKPMPPPPGAAVNSSKPAHPFFTGNPSRISTAARKTETRAAPLAPENARPTSVTFSTPSKLRRSQQPPAPSQEDDVPVDIRTARLYKVPGTVDPAFPSKDLHHVGQHPERDLHRRQLADRPSYHKTRRKAKESRVSTKESLLHRFSQSLDLRRTHSAVAGPSPCRSVVSATALRDQALQRLSEWPAFESKTRHPALRIVLEKIASSQSAFDQGQCETQAWTVKYAPQSTSEVLQPEKELRVLKQWLESQVVSSTHIDYSQSKEVPSKRRKKRRKLKKDNMDDFVVEDDADAELQDLSEDEGSVASTGPVMKSLVQNSSSTTVKSSRKANAVLISGPHGCGKTAAIFAAAKELDFDVFELGPNSRRSAKDILDKVGDMARYHQVSRSNKEIAKVEQHEEESKDAEETSDLPTERSQDQSALTNFFKTYAAPKKKPLPKPMPSVSKPHMKPQEQSKTTNTSSTRQTQSIILLEEVDVLFEQDKQFWETIMDLAMHSRRPIVMTCSDENPVPADDLALHALLRFRQPSDVLASGYLTLVAASEGHLLQPEVVMSLHRSKGNDLRASIAQLNFWCQMGLGDRKGGLEWFLPHWPPGSNMDGNGQKLRVVSDGTYHSDTTSVQQKCEDNQSDGDVDRLLSDACREEIFDPCALSLNAITRRLAQSSDAMPVKDPQQSMTLLSHVDDLASLLSTADVFTFPCSTLDPTQPQISLQRRSDYAINPQLLDTPEYTDYSGVNTQVASSLHAGIAYYAAHGRSNHSINGKADDNNARLKGLTEEIDKQQIDPDSSDSLARTMNKTRLEKALEPLLDPLFEPGTNSVLAQEIAPYARSIARFDMALEQCRANINGAGKKARSTRASRSALEGNMRCKTRRERWFDKTLDLKSITETAGSGWPSSIPVLDHRDRDSISETGGSRESSVDQLGEDTHHESPM